MPGNAQLKKFSNPGLQITCPTPDLFLLSRRLVGRCFVSRLFVGRRLRSRLKIVAPFLQVCNSIYIASQLYVYSLGSLSWLRGHNGASLISSNASASKLHRLRLFNFEILFDGCAPVTNNCLVCLVLTDDDDDDDDDDDNDDGISWAAPRGVNSIKFQVLRNLLRIQFQTCL